MAEIVCSVEIDAPADDVWVAVTDWRRQGEWLPATEVRPTHQDGRGVGARIEAVTGIGRVGVPDRMQVVVWDPPRRCLVRHDGPLLRGGGGFEVEPLGERRARVVWSEWIDPPLGVAGDVVFFAARPLVRWFYGVALRRLARWVRARESAGR